MVRGPVVADCQRFSDHAERDLLRGFATEVQPGRPVETVAICGWKIAVERLQKALEAVARTNDTDVRDLRL